MDEPWFLEHEGHDEVAALGYSDASGVNPGRRLFEAAVDDLDCTGLESVPLEAAQRFL
jgi:hypothetical protein